MPATFHFSLREYAPNKQGRCLIYLRITCNRKKKYYNTGIRLKPTYWRKDAERVSRSHGTYKKLNEDLELILSEANEAARLLRREKRESAEAIKQRMLGASNENFFTFAETHLQKLASKEQYYLRKQTKATIKKLKAFNGSTNLLFTEINSQYLESFQDFMLNEYGNKASTIAKNMNDIRRILKEAKKKQLIFRDVFENVEPIKVEKPAYKTKLSYSEIQKLENLKLNGIQEQARNAFVLAFYLSGMRFGDLATLQWQNVSGGVLSYEMSKTGTPIQQKIPQQAQKILKQYREPDSIPESYVLPLCEDIPPENSSELKRRISSLNANINARLKELATLAGIDKVLSMHTARHSFAQHGVSKGNSVYRMQQLLGHASVKTTQNYLKRIDVEAKNKAIDSMF
jgi:site-specific recombinase XerD